MAIACLVLLATLFLNAATNSKCPCDGLSQQSLYFPYGTDNSDWMVGDATEPITYYVDSSIGYRLFGNSGQLKPIGIIMVVSCLL